MLARLVSRLKVVELCCSACCYRVFRMRIFCSICKDIYIPYSEVHVTNCGHLYHGACISTWIKQHRTCPQCRASLSQPFRVYFDVEKGEETDSVTLERQVEVLTDRLRETEKCKRNLLDEKKNLEKIIVDMKECAVSLTKRNDLLRVSANALKEEVKRLSKQNEAVTRLKGEVEGLKAKVATFERVETVMKGSAEEVNKLMEGTPVTALAVKQLCTYVGVLKDQLNKVEGKNTKLIKENRDMSRALAVEKEKHLSGSEELIRSLRAKNRQLENDLNSLNVLFKDCKRKYSKRLKPAVPASNCTNQEPPKNKFLDLNIDAFLCAEDSTKEVARPVESDRAIKKWEELVCAGPTKNLGFSRARYFGTALCDQDENSELSLSEFFGFDGFGGRKKVRLGGPTPSEEFEKLKQKKEKRGGQAFQHKKIFEYFQMDCEN